MSSAIVSAGVFAAFIVGSLGLITVIGVMPTSFPVITFSFHCDDINSRVGIECPLVTSANPEFTVGACGCYGAACSPYKKNINNITFLTTACKVELYQQMNWNGYNVIQYKPLSGLRLKINGLKFESARYTPLQVNTIVFGSYFCNGFHYNDTAFPSLISNLDHTKCASISHPTQTIDPRQLQTLMGQAGPLLLFLPQNSNSMIIADKAYLPLGFTLKSASDSTPTTLVSTGIYTTVDMNYNGARSSCTIRYSTTEEDSTLSVYTFAELCSPEIMPSGIITEIEASGSSTTSNTANLCDGSTGACVSQCFQVYTCVEAPAASDPLSGIVQGLVGNATRILPMLPSLGTNVDPIGTLTKYIIEAVAFNPSSK